MVARSVLLSRHRHEGHVRAFSKVHESTSPTDVVFTEQQRGIIRQRIGTTMRDVTPKRRLGIMVDWLAEKQLDRGVNVSEGMSRYVNRQQVEDPTFINAEPVEGSVAAKRW
ncbi:hypothetical protein ColTof3_14604 [Colletotrichum tofieldiae]|nr:hypothetical protein ColTof3_14604 [Colletotrichum tofieldiae]